MTIREKLLGIGQAYLQRGEPIPLDLLAEADKWGLSLSDFGQPTISHATIEGDENYGKSTKNKIHDA